MEKFPKFKEAPKEKKELELIKPQEELEKEPPTYPSEIERKLLEFRKKGHLPTPEELTEIGASLTPEEREEKRWSTGAEKHMEWLITQKEIEELTKAFDVKEKPQETKTDIEKQEKRAA